MNDTSDQPVPLEEELQLCRKYLHIESLRLDDRLSVNWQIGADPAQVKIPMLTLQPLLENAIYHGIQPLPGGGVIKVEVDERDGQLTATISNPVSGHGHAHERGNRMALDNIRRRLEAIYGERASVATRQGEQDFKLTISFPSLPTKL